MFEAELALHGARFYVEKARGNAGRQQEGEMPPTLPPGERACDLASAPSVDAAGVGSALPPKLAAERAAEQQHASAPPGYDEVMGGGSGSGGGGGASSSDEVAALREELAAQRREMEALRAQVGGASVSEKP